MVILWGRSQWLVDIVGFRGMAENDHISMAGSQSLTLIIQAEGPRPGFYAGL